MRYGSVQFWVALFSILFIGAAKAGEETRPIVPPYKVWNQVPSVALRDSAAISPDRVTLPNGMVVFLLEDPELPLIECTFMLRFGEIHEPAGLTGVTAAAMTVMRSGGSAECPGDALDAALDATAAVVNFTAAPDVSTVSINALKDDFVGVLEKTAGILRAPAFPDEKLTLHLNQARAAIAKRNDNPSQLATREFRRALYGKDSPYGRIPEYATLAKIDRAALLAFHRQNVHPATMICGISGDFKKNDILAALNKAFDWWPHAAVEKAGTPAISFSRARTLYVERPKINQTTIVMGHGLELRRDHPDFVALQMMNEVLSGGMSARLFTEVRTKKGLAYSVRGQAQANYDRPGLFYASVLTRNEQALDAVAAVREEIARMCKDGVSQSELEQAREGILNSQVFQVDTPAKILNRQMTYELYGYPADFWRTLLAALKAVTPADVQRVAKAYLTNPDTVLLGVGSTDGLGPAQSFKSLPGVETLDVSIPTP